MAIMDDPSDPQRHTSRTLYPDLPSAYAQIQGRRVASSQKTRSSGVETRFPLSPSSSSSEEAEDDLNPLTLGNDAIPLQDLPCRRVPSAMGILHEAEDHQESSAILESTHDTLDVDRAERQSLTLDEIVAQYADPTPAASPLAASHNNEAYGFSFLPRTQFLHRGQEEDNGCMENVAVGRLQNSREHLLIQKHASEVCSEQGNAPIVTSFDDPADSENEDEEWETPPDTSRRGFLNPSRSRFRLTKRDTGESSQLTVGVANTPATPWDPLSNTTEPPMYRHGFRRKDRSQYDQEHTSPTHRPSKIYPVNDNRILGAQGQRLGTVHEKQLHATEEVSRLNSARAPGPNTQTSQLGVRSSSPLSNSTQFALRDMSSNPPTLLSSRFTDKTLPSSSLLPRASDKALHRTPSSRTTMSSAGDDNIFQNQYVGSHSLESHTSTDKNHHEDNSNAPRLATITNRNETAVDGLIDTNGSKTQNTSLMSTTESSGQRSTSYNTQNARDPLEAQVRQIFVHGGYTTSDGDISRFLRDTRHRHEQNGSVQQEGTTNLGNTHAGIKTTGSSLANYSFVSLTSIGHQKLKCAEENKNSSKDESPAVADNGLWTSRKLLGTSEDAAENTSIRSASSHSSLLRPTGTSLARTCFTPLHSLEYRFHTS